MAREPTFAETIVSQLGAPQEPFGLYDVLLLAALLAAGAAYIALELGLGWLIGRFSARARGKAQEDEQEIRPD